MLNIMIMKITEIKLLKLLASFVLILSLFTNNAFAEERESRALVVASQQAVLSSELAAKIDNIPVYGLDKDCPGPYTF